MDWKRRRGIERLTNGILEINTRKVPPIQILNEIFKKHNILFREISESDEFCGIFFVKGNKKGIVVNSNLYDRRRNFTIAHELGHYFLDHPLGSSGTIICDTNAVFGRDKPEPEKEADYFASCLLMPREMVIQQYNKCKSNNSQLSISGLNDDSIKNELINELSNYFQVSKESMGYRLDEVIR